MPEKLKRHLPYILISVIFIVLIGTLVWRSNTHEAIFDWTSYDGLELTDAEKQNYQNATTQVKENPSDFRGYIALGNLRNKGGDPDGAIALYQKAIDVNANDNIARNNLAEVYMSLGEYIKAEEQYLRIVELNPAWTEAYRDLIELYRYKITNKQDQIPVIAEQAIKNNPQNSLEFLSILARYYWETKQYDPALATYDRLQAIAPNDDLIKQDIDMILKERSAN